jgi:integrase
VKKASPEVTVISPEERGRLFDALILRVRLLAEALYVTGARVSEVLGIRRDQVKENGTVELRLHGKGGKEREGRIPAQLYRRILKVFPEGTYLFESRQGSTSSGSTSQGRLHGLRGGCSGDPSRRTCCATRGRRTCWQARRG